MEDLTDSGSHCDNHPFLDDISLIIFLEQILRNVFWNFFFHPHKMYTFCDNPYKHHCTRAAHQNIKAGETRIVTSRYTKRRAKLELC